MVLAGCLGQAAVAAVYHVDQNHPAASDANPGTAEQPWQTLYRAMEHELAPGDTVLVKAGRYRIDRGGAWNKAALNPPASGLPDKPITIKSEPMHAAVLEGPGTGDVPVIGSFSRNHIVIDGFEVVNPGAKGIAVFGAPDRRVQGVVVQNNIVHGVYVGGGDNADAIRVERASGAIVRNNRLYDVRNDAGSTNAAGVKLYWSDNVVIENNEIYDVVAGIKEKENGEFIDIRRNLIRDCGAGFELMNQNTLTTQQYRFYENIVRNCSTAVESKNVSTAVMRGVYIYNNVFVDYEHKAVSGTRYGSDRRIWNNIFYRTGGAPTQGDMYTYLDPPVEIELMDYNLYYQDPKIVIGLYRSNRRYDTLAQWQRSGFGYDLHSMVADPQFVDPLHGDFHLLPTSPARDAGRLDGTPNSPVVDIGAYPRGEAVIGPHWS